MEDVGTSLGSLDSFERDVLVVLALAGEGELTPGELLRAAHRAGLGQARGPQLTAAALEDTCTAFGELVVRTSGTLALAERWLVPVLEDAVARDRLGPLSAKLAEPGVRHGVSTLGRLGDTRMALALGDATLFDFAVKRTLWSRSAPESDPIWVRVLGLHPSAAWLDTLGPRYCAFYLRCALDRAFLEATAPSSAVFDAARATGEPEIRARLATLLAVLGRTQEASAALVGNSVLVQYARSFVELVLDRPSEARKGFAAAARAGRSLPHLVPFALLALLTDPAADLASLKTTVDKLARKPSSHPFALAALGELVLLRAGREREPSAATPAGGWVNFLVPAVVARYRGVAPGFDVRAVRAAAAREGFGWIAEQLGDAASLGRLWTRREAWELALEALHPTDDVAAPRAEDGEIVWEVRPSQWDDSLGVTARWMAPNARKGKELPLAHFESGEIVPKDPHDRTIAAALVAARQTRTRLTRRQLALFVGHPRVRSSSGLPVRVDERPARLVVETTAQGALLQLDPPSFDETGVLVVEEPDALTLVQQTPETERISRILGGSSLRIPARGLDRLGGLLESLGKAVQIVAHGGLKQDEEAGDARLHVQLTRSATEAALFVRLRVVPRAGGPDFEIGEPPEVLLSPASSGLGSVRRNLPGERRALDALFERCPSLRECERVGDELRAELGVGLGLLAELAALGRTESFPRVVISWRRGKPLTLHALHAPDKQVRFTLRGNTRWLSVEGTVRLDDGRLLPMQQLLDAMDRARGRFVEVAPGEFLELAADLRETLENLVLARALGPKQQVPGALVPALETWTRNYETTWEAGLEARRTAPDALFTVPAELRATLRDYQVEGFEFLARRAAAGSGAILADDMGLGKTVQTLALLLARRHGPALVVAPTSVLHNWQTEARRFAPALRTRAYRPGVEAGPGDVVLISYGLLAQHHEKLKDRTWATLVFDEAHALKNPATLRWKAARALRADACVALTGTPVENHVGELHALFDVVEPGMLGSRTTFRRMIAVPMARGERRAAALLRRLVRPVILRRTKAEVLTELPPKTEMVRLVAASAEHRAFYEAVRLRALARLQDARSLPQTGRGKAHIEILAELTRLRRAAIDPRLVAGPTAPAGSKLDVLLHVVRELREEGHRALVFSQFLEVLDLAGERLAQDDVACLRLDGTMAAGARTAVIDAFQGGTGDVLLASLKAGGVGVNLTAADFVIHLDPWWNPAVEDQATDRTHRYGQTRPVTVIRLCTENTVEEKVLAMHADKRRLYQDVIGDADGLGALERWTELIGS